MNRMQLVGQLQELQRALTHASNEIDYRKQLSVSGKSTNAYQRLVPALWVKYSVVTFGLALVASMLAPELFYFIYYVIDTYVYSWLPFGRANLLHLAGWVFFFAVLFRIGIFLYDRKQSSPGSKRYQAVVAHNASIQSQIAESKQRERQWMQVYVNLGGEQFFPARYCTPRNVQLVTEFIRDHRANSIQEAVVLLQRFLEQRQRDQKTEQFRQELLREQRRARAEARGNALLTAWSIDDLKRRY